MSLQLWINVFIKKGKSSLIINLRVRHWLLIWQDWHDKRNIEHHNCIFRMCQCSMQWNWKRLTRAWYVSSITCWSETHFRYILVTGGKVVVTPAKLCQKKVCNSMALSGHALLTRNPAHNQLQPHNKRDIHGVVRTACANCTECPQVDWHAVL